MTSSTHVEVMIIESGEAGKGMPRTQGQNRGSNTALDLLSARKAANVQLKFKDVTFTVATKSGTKQILHGISGGVNSGEVLAVLGPSGAGKTSLIDLLTLEDKGGESVGDVRLNGHVMSKSIFTKYCATVPQQYKHWAFLTCRETVAFAADLYLDLPVAEKTQGVDAVLQTMVLSGRGAFPLVHFSAQPEPFWSMTSPFNNDPNISHKKCLGEPELWSVYLCPCSAAAPTPRWATRSSRGSRQGLPPVHFSAQRELFLSLKMVKSTGTTRP